METRQQYADTIDLKIDAINPPRLILRPIDDVVVSELARSIENAGLLQPIAVRKSAEGYEVVFGNHRLEACKRLGWNKIPSIVREWSNDEAFLARISENLIRNTEINSLEEAKGYRMLVDNGWTVNSIGLKIGKSDSYVCQRLAMLDRLDESLLFRLRNNSKSNLTPSHMELLSTVRDRVKQQELAHLVEKKRLSVRALENLLKGIPSPTNVLLENSGGQCSVKIPDDFAKAVKFRAGQSLRMYVRGKKLILEASGPSRPIQNLTRVNFTRGNSIEYSSRGNSS